MRVDGEGRAERFKRCAVLAEFFVNETQACVGAKMARLALQCFLNGGDGARIIFAAIGEVGALVLS